MLKWKIESFRKIVKKPVSQLKKKKQKKDFQKIIQYSVVIAMARIPRNRK